MGILKYVLTQVPGLILEGFGVCSERTLPATENFVREISAGRVFFLSAALDRVHWLLSQQKKVFGEGEAISLFSGMHGT